MADPILTAALVRCDQFVIAGTVFERLAEPVKVLCGFTYSELVSRLRGQPPSARAVARAHKEQHHEEFERPVSDRLCVGSGGGVSRDD
jgi:hypothetical protein